jgi:hypothetical protein
MRFLSSALITLALLGGCLFLVPVGAVGPVACCAPDPVLSRPEVRVAQEVVDYSVIVYNSKRQLVGSGVRVAEGVLTAKHVTDAALRTSSDTLDWPLIVVTKNVFGAETSRRARLVRDLAKHDLALLEVWMGFGSSYKPAPLATGLPVVGEDCWYCGGGGGLPFNLDRSIINQTNPEETVVNGNVWYGHSGSGVFVRRKGRAVLIGVVHKAAVVPVYEKVPGSISTVRQITDFLAGKK